MSTNVVNANATAVANVATNSYDKLLTNDMFIKKKLVYWRKVKPANALAFHLLVSNIYGVCRFAKRPAAWRVGKQIWKWAWQPQELIGGSKFFPRLPRHSELDPHARGGKCKKQMVLHTQRGLL